MDNIVEYKGQIFQANTYYLNDKDQVVLLIAKKKNTPIPYLEIILVMDSSDHRPQLYSGKLRPIPEDKIGKVNNFEPNKGQLCAFFNTPFLNKDPVFAQFEYKDTETGAYHATNGFDWPYCRPVNEAEWEALKVGSDVL